GGTTHCLLLMLRILLRVQAWHRVRERTSGEWAGTELERWAGTRVSRFGITTRLIVDGGGAIASRPKKILSRSTESPSRTPARPVSVGRNRTCQDGPPSLRS